MAGRWMGGKDHIIKRLILGTVERCGVCGSQFDIEDLRVLGHQQDVWFLMMICRQCRTQGLLAVTVTEEKARLAEGGLTDAQGPRLKVGRPVTADDILDIHQFLKDFDGDFARLFGQKG